MTFELWLKSHKQILITYNKTQPSIFDPKLKIHYIYFTLNGIEYIYSETDKSYVLTYMDNNNVERYLYQGKNREMPIRIMDGRV